MFFGTLAKSGIWDPYELDAFKSPCDIGGNIPGIGRVNSMYDLLGSSYTLNDHALQSEQAATLVPLAGGTRLRHGLPRRLVPADQRRHFHRGFGCRRSVAQLSGVDCLRRRLCRRSLRGAAEAGGLT